MAEIAPAETFFKTPEHPYTQMLISSIPVISEEEEALKLALLEGVNTELIPLADLTIQFDLDHVFSEPRFESFQVTMLTDLASW